MSCLPFPLPGRRIALRLVGGWVCVRRDLLAAGLDDELVLHDDVGEALASIFEREGETLQVTRSRHRSLFRCEPSGSVVANSFKALWSRANTSQKTVHCGLTPTLSLWIGGACSADPAGRVEGSARCSRRGAASGDFARVSGRHGGKWSWLQCTTAMSRRTGCWGRPNAAIGPRGWMAGPTGWPGRAATWHTP